MYADGERLTIAVMVVLPFHLGRFSPQVVPRMIATGHRLSTVVLKFVQVNGLQSPLVNGYRPCWSYPGLQPDSSATTSLICGYAVMGALSSAGSP